MTRRIPAERSPVKVLLLCLFTFGIYYLYWIYRTSKEMDEFLGETIDVPPIVHLLLFFFTGTIWGYAWDVLTARKLTRMQIAAGLPVTDNTLLYLLFDILGVGPMIGVGIVVPLLQQTSMNEAYRAARRTYVGAW